jgi:hypothetical protein
VVVVDPQPPKVSDGLADRMLLPEVEINEETGLALAAPPELTTQLAGPATVTADKV